MFVYNISQKVNQAILNEWLIWQKEIHIPEIMSTGLFRDFKFYKLLDQDDSNGSTYIIQYFVENKENYERYIKMHAPGLREQATKKWGDGFVAFRSLMQVV